ncbi:MAG: biotin carboxylase N-terminal domain-containing protein [Polyangiales bacterium]
MSSRLFHRLFIANRGEVAVRVARTCDALGIVPVFGVSEADRTAPYLRGREHVVLGPSRAAESYLDRVKVVQAAVQTRCTALHPGWGFLSEDPVFASLCESHGVTFIGPPAHAMALMGKKSPAKRAMAIAGLRLIPGSDGILESAAQAEEIATATGYPVLLKAESGGGGRGMRIVREAGRVTSAFEEASAEALSCFGDPRVYMEKLVERGRHIEIQMLADRYGNVVHLGERDCTVQRNHQKLVEESPALALSAEERARTFDAAVRAARNIGYVGAGTMEFLLDADGTLRFMEMNTRLQVEHCVTEMRTGLDLVAEQIRVAAGHRLSIAQEDVKLEGHAIECRINAEDPDQGFRPAPGRIARWHVPTDGVPEGCRVRVDTHVEDGYEVPPFYDSLLCKVLAHGPTRELACDALASVLERLVCEGVPTTASMHVKILRSSEFRSNAYDTSFIPGFTTAPKGEH